MQVRQLRQDEGAHSLIDIPCDFVLAQLLLNHPKDCATRAQGGCDTCRRVWALLKIYARHRRKDNGTIPAQLRDHLRAIAQQSRAQQQAMDERRRNAMNAAYARIP